MVAWNTHIFIFGWCEYFLIGISLDLLAVLIARSLCTFVVYFETIVVKNKTSRYEEN